MEEQFNKIPKTIKDIGEETFIKVPLYKKNDKLEVIYINPKLYEKIFKKKYNYEEAKKDIINKFSVTLENNGNLMDYAYVDKQEDPTDIALNGNKGSGRAFYLYENFNIKGEKTPFATSPRDDYNNGKYSLDCAIHECLISNVLNNQNDFNNFETLAIIDKNEEFLFPYINTKLPCGILIRYYEDKELYRFSHRFVNKIPFFKDELTNISKKIGELEGNKFIKRFLHGAWSIGNLSINSNMIDLDTSFFVLGRHPQWSFTDKFITNYFGFEEKGQIKVLETILNSELNINKVELEDISKIIENEKIKTIRKKFPIIIGYSENEYKKYSQEFDALSDEFIYLSQLIFDNYDNLNCQDRNCENTNLFDFSKFFRYYEISKEKGIWNKQYGLKLLLNNNAKIIGYNYIDENYHKKIINFFDNIIVNNTNKYLESIDRALKFIDKFDSLNTIIDKNEKIDKNMKLIKAYIENEDKVYLTAGKWMRGQLIELYKEKGSKYVNTIMNKIIDIYSEKNYSNNKLLSDLFIFDKGVLYREISPNGFNRICIELSKSLNNNEIKMYLNSEEIVLKSNDYINYYSDKIDNLKLIPINEVILQDGTKKIYCVEYAHENRNYIKYAENIFDKSKHITEEEIKKYLKEYYDIEVLEIEIIPGSTTKCYCIKSRDNKYFLKIFEQEKDIHSIIEENKILEILTNNKILVPEIIKTNNNKISLFINDHFMILENYVEGKTYHQEKLSKELLLETAKILGKIHKVLNNEFICDYNNIYSQKINIEEQCRDIDYLVSMIEENKNDKNYITLKESLEYKKNMITKIENYSELFNDLTISMTHGDYSKRQIISKDNNNCYVVDFSSCDVLPLSLEVIRSYFLSTLSCKQEQNFDYDLFSTYVETYLKEFELKEQDLIAMPYLLLYHFTLSKYGYLDYVYNKDEEIIEFIVLKDKICKFLEKNTEKIITKIKTLNERLQKDKKYYIIKQR